jgi:hypothetical protein
LCASSSSAFVLDAPRRYPCRAPPLLKSVADRTGLGVAEPLNPFRGRDRGAGNPRRKCSSSASVPLSLSVLRLYRPVESSPLLGDGRGDCSLEDAVPGLYRVWRSSKFWRW